MDSLHRGRLRARIASGAADVARAQRLRHRAFIAGRPGARPRPTGRDADAFDPLCRHVLVETAEGGLRACFRLLSLAQGAEIHRSYSAQRYDLTPLAGYRRPMLEVGRFCVHPDHSGDPDVLRLAWAALARVIDSRDVGFVFGCSSFPGADAARHREALAWLAAHHLAPRHWRPRIKAQQIVPLARDAAAPPDPGRAQRALPPLLRSYLGMGGWVSDHAVVDDDLDTLHVFTGLEVAAIPPARARLLRATAAA
ncbi:MAG: GNAT family N-acetyltransferase [Alkalilacustris sp.]